MVVPSDRLEKRLLLRLLRVPLPLNMLGNAMQRRAVAELRRQGLVRVLHRKNPGTLVKLTEKGEKLAKEILAGMAKRRR